MHSEVPGAVVFDKVDIWGPGTLEVFNYLQAAAAKSLLVPGSLVPKWTPKWCAECASHAIKWNYYKFLVDAEGRFIPYGVFESNQSPVAAETMIRRYLGLPALIDTTGPARPEPAPSKLGEDD